MPKVHAMTPEPQRPSRHRSDLDDLSMSEDDEAGEEQNLDRIEMMHIQ